MTALGVDVRKMVATAVKLLDGDGLYNDVGECGCGLDDMSPGDCLTTECVAAKSKRFEECSLEQQDNLRSNDIGPGGVAWFPIRFRDGLSMG